MQSISLCSDEAAWARVLWRRLLEQHSMFVKAGNSDSGDLAQSAQAVQIPSGTASPKVRSGRSLYLVMSITIIAIVAFGFGQTIEGALLHAPSPRPRILYLHIVLFTGWILLFATQASLIRVRRIMWHRRLGTATAFVGAAMPVVGIAAAIMMKQLHAAEGHTARAISLVVPVFDMLAFAVSFGLAIRWRHRTEYHRRLMLMATCGLTVAAFARFPSWLMPNNCFYLGVDGLILAAIAWEWYGTRRVHPVYRYGLAALVIGQGLTMWIFLS